MDIRGNLLNLLLYGVNEISNIICVRAMVFDFDGVFTDNSVIIDENGKESIICNRGDGLGIEIVKKLGILLLVISKENNPVVQKRCKKLGIPCFYGINDKKSVLLTWLNDLAIDPKNVIYVGNDINDIDCLQHVGCAVVVADAHNDVKRFAKIILKNKGGHGAVRELCDMVLDKNGLIVI